MTEDEWEDVGDGEAHGTAMEEDKPSDAPKSAPAWGPVLLASTVPSLVAH